MAVALIAVTIIQMRFIHLAIVLGLASTSACSKKQAAVPAKPTPSNSDTTGAPAPGGADPSTASPDAKSTESGTRGPVKKGGDPCEGGQ